MFDSQVLSVRFGPAHVAIFGHQPHFLHDKNHTAEKLAIALGADPKSISLTVTASGPQDEGFKMPKAAKPGKLLQGEGLMGITERKAAGGLQTADCAAVIVYDPDRDNFGIYHAGRQALDSKLGNECSNCEITIIENAIPMLVGQADRSRLQVLVVGNICGPCFKHEHADAEKHVANFRSLPGHVFANPELGALDLFEVIKYRLEAQGVLAGNIHQAGPCTLETPSLSSYRRDKTKLRNTILLVRD